MSGVRSKFRKTWLEYTFSNLPLNFFFRNSDIPLSNKKRIKFKQCFIAEQL